MTFMFIMLTVVYFLIPGYHYCFS
uniref:Uncharacterized protein n=1 Tax=Arundo donax TaxID=35708 RepID=A0A0A9G0G3_ARUDO